MVNMTVSKSAVKITNHPHQAWFLDRHPCGSAEFSVSPLCAPGLWPQLPHLALSQLGRRAGNGIPLNLENGGTAFADSIWASKQKTDLSGVVPKANHGGARVMAQPIEGLLCKQEDLCVIPSTYMVKAMHGGTHVRFPALGKQKAAGP